MRINGCEERVATGTTLAAYLRSRQVDPAGVVVAVNLEVVPRERFEDRVLQEHDAVEILKFMGGG